MRKREDRLPIKDEWIEPVVQYPLQQVVQADGRIRRWAAVEAAGGRYLRVVLLSGSQRVFRSEVHAMKIRYFEDTDTLYIELKAGRVADTNDLDENTLIEVDDQGRMLAITIEHAQLRAELPQFSYEQIAAWRGLMRPVLRLGSRAIASAVLHADHGGVIRINGAT
jgi:uncharacterized protein YuzE